MSEISHSVTVFDERRCELGEGVFWHPQRSQLFWFDILDKKLMSNKDGKEYVWKFEYYVSAAGWLDEQRILIASEQGLIDFNVETGSKELIKPVEIENVITRSNDGRADPWGGFWFSTMGKNAESNAGTIYRYYQGSVTPLYSSITIPNAICFSKKDALAYYTDTVKQIIWKQPLNAATGDPEEEVSEFINFAVDNENPDGAVVDGEDNLWVAIWGKGKVVCYDKLGCKIQTVVFPVPHVSCPLIVEGKLYVTSANEGLSEPERNQYRDSGKTFVADLKGLNQDHHKIQISQ